MDWCYHCSSGAHYVECCISDRFIIISTLANVVSLYIQSNHFIYLFTNVAVSPQSIKSSTESDDNDTDSDEDEDSTT